MGFFEFIGGFFGPSQDKVAIGFDPKKMKDQDIKLHCATKFGGDPVQTAACIDGIVKMRGQESCKTVQGVTTCTKIVSSEFKGGFTPGFKEESSGDPIVNECKRMFPNDPTALKPCVASMYDCKNMFPNDPTAMKPCFEKSMMKFKKAGGVLVESVGGQIIGGTSGGSVTKTLGGTSEQMMYGTIGGMGTETAFKEGVISGKIGNVASGYCAEGSVCGTPIYGRPLWVWILALLVILLALQGLQDR